MSPRVRKPSKKRQPSPSPVPDRANRKNEHLKDKKERAAPVKWDDNKHWTQRAINYLFENASFRLKLFSDSTSNAKDEKRRKVQNGEGKGILYGELAAHIFGDDPNPDIKAAYDADPHKYSRSTQMQFQR
jgi:hypothetical protein